MSKGMFHEYPGYYWIVSHWLWKLTVSGMQQGLRKQCIPWQIPSGKGGELAILSPAMQGLDNDKEGPATLTSEGACSPHAGLWGVLKVTTLFSQPWVCIRCCGWTTMISPYCCLQWLWERNHRCQGGCTRNFWEGTWLCSGSTYLGGLWQSWPLSEQPSLSNMPSFAYAEQFWVEPTHLWWQLPHLSCAVSRSWGVHLFEEVFYQLLTAPSPLPCHLVIFL